MAQEKKSSLSGSADPPTRVVGRRVVSAPGRTIQIERVQISEQQRSSVSFALRTGRANVSASE